jgi:hypothetical protein
METSEIIAGLKSGQLIIHNGAIVKNAELEAIFKAEEKIEDLELQQMSKKLTLKF